VSNTHTGFTGVFYPSGNLLGFYRSGNLLGFLILLDILETYGVFSPENLLGLFIFLENYFAKSFAKGANSAMATPKIIASKKCYEQNHQNFVE